jgi:NADH:ubiquinone oxidoreductase subunit 6 (subunit J)
MILFALSPTQLAAGQIALAAALAIAGFTLLLPRPRGRFVPGGIAALVAAISVLGAWLYTTFGDPMPDPIGTILFCLFSIGALVFGTVLVVQRNPARGAIAFAFVILSTCGLFLLLAAPFLMAVTIIIYAGAIIVTFLFVLMLSQVSGPSDENDRSREPLFGSLAGFAFTGLVLFTIYLTALGNSPAKAEGGGEPTPRQVLPAPVLTNEERSALTSVIAKLDEALALFSSDVPQAKRTADAVPDALAAIVGRSSNDAGKLRARLERTPRNARESIEPYRLDTQSQDVLNRAKTIRILNESVETLLVEGKADATVVKAEIEKLRAETLLLLGSGELPARNVSNIAYTLYADRLLAVEMAGTLLLVATIGAVAIAQRRGAAA